MMKNLLLTCILAFATSLSHAQLLANQEFTGLSNSALGTQAGWNPSATPLSNDIQISASGGSYTALTRTGYPFGGGPNIRVDNINGKSTHRNFAANFADQTSTYFISFLVRIPSIGGVSLIPEYSLSLYNTVNGASPARFYVRRNNFLGIPLGNFSFGISVGGSPVEYSSATYTAGNTYLIVIRYDVVTGGSSNDDMWLWVNPDFNAASLPSTGSAQVSAINDAEAGYGSVINGLRLRQVFTSNAFLGIDSYTAEALYDGIRVARGSTPNAAWIALTNVSDVVLPVRFTQFKAAQKGSPVQLSWTNATEEGVTAYTVERSSNGSSYEAIATVTPVANNNTYASYQFLDAAPLSGSNYYRIKAVEAGGKITYTSVAKINMSAGSGVQLVISPNPVRNKVASVQFNNLPSGKYAVKIVGNGGQVVYGETINHAGGSFSQAVNLTGVKAGLYYLVVNGSVTLQKQFVLE